MNKPKFRWHLWPLGFVTSMFWSALIWGRIFLVLALWSRWAYGRGEKYESITTLDGHTYENVTIARIDYKSETVCVIHKKGVEGIKFGVLPGNISKALGLSKLQRDASLNEMIEQLQVSTHSPTEDCGQHDAKVVNVTGQPAQRLDNVPQADLMAAEKWGGDAIFKNFRLVYDKISNGNPLVVPVFFLVVMVFVSFIWLLHRKENEFRQEREDELEKAKRRDELKRKQSAILASLKDSLYDAKISAINLPVLMAKARQELDLAEKWLYEDAPSLFWEKMEAAHAYLLRFGCEFSNLSQRCEDYRQLVESEHLDGVAPQFDLGALVLLDGKEMFERERSLFVKGHKQTDFALVYEQRRTNSNLRDLISATREESGKMRSELASLRNKMSSNLSGLESALLASVKELGLIREGQARLVDAADHDSIAHDELVTISRASLDIARKREMECERLGKDALDMLDNIQRKRRPLPWKLGDNNFERRRQD